MWKLVTFVMAALMLATPAFAQGGKGGGAGAPRGEHRFLMRTAEDGQAEVKLGQLAADKGSSDAVKQFGQQLVSDHARSNDELVKLMQSKGLTPPDKMSAKAQKEYDRLSKLSGAQFDREFMKFIVKDHEQDVKEFRHEAQRSKDPDVKNFASQMLPKLEEHLQMAKQVEQQAASASPRTRY